jgi:DGQHR domain-containing protein
VVSPGIRGPGRASECGGRYGERAEADTPGRTGAAVYNLYRFDGSLGERHSEASLRPRRRRGMTDDSHEVLMTKTAPASRDVHALVVRQWLEHWDDVKFDERHHRRKPEPHFYMFTLPAVELKALSGIYKRSTADGQLRSVDLGIQRRHDEERSKRIQEFVKHGYPWSDLNDTKRSSGDFNHLLKPGWLPTAVVINILKPNEKRQGVGVASDDLIHVTGQDQPIATISLPKNFNGANWAPSKRHPIEVIDGQHRLWAFDEALKGSFDLPVVAFYGLDISWQAYLFWSINITPKRINASLAFDLYPLLRTEDWLDRFEGHSVYRETRAQELTEALWSHPESAWYHRINMLGETGERKMVTQASWIRSLMSTYIRHWEGSKIRIGGLFGAPLGSHQQVLPWARAQQAAFLIVLGRYLRDAVKKTQADWAADLRKTQTDLIGIEDPAFAGANSLINTDQGIRGMLYVTNDLCFINAKTLKLNTWMTSEDAAAADVGAVTDAMNSLESQPVTAFLKQIAEHLAEFDWRTSSTPGLPENERVRKAALRGAGGYKEIRLWLLRHLAETEGAVGDSARKVMHTLNYK